MRYDAKMFQVHKTKKLLTVEASQLTAISVDPFGRLYQDTYDRGLILSSNAGRQATFFIDKVTRSLDADRNILSWTLKPTLETLHAIPELAGWQIAVFND